MNRFLLPLLVINVIVAGCATVEIGATAQEPREEAVYRTGSNIPQKQKPGSTEGISTYDKEQLERWRTETAPPMGQPGLPPPGGGR